MAAIPKYKSSYGKVELAFLHNGNMMPVGLGPCSKCVDIQQRHHEGDRCWGTFESQWHLQGDTSMKCVQTSYNLDRFDGYYTSPQSDTVHVQDVMDDGASVATAQRSINKSLRWPDANPKMRATGINVPDTKQPGPSAWQQQPGLSYTSQGYVAQTQQPQMEISGSTIFSDTMWSLFSKPFQ